jgi:hypothetical protein
MLMHADLPRLIGTSNQTSSGEYWAKDEVIGSKYLPESNIMDKHRVRMIYQVTGDKTVICGSRSFNMFSLGF